MADADLICRLYLDERISLNTKQFKPILQHNQTRLRPPSKTRPSAKTYTNIAPGARPPTPEPTEDSPVFQHFFELRFSHGPRLPRGFTIGANPDTCDIVFPESDGVSNQHCAISFVVNENGQTPFLVVRDLGSKFGTEVEYDGQGKNEKRSNFQWIIGGHETVRVENVRLKIPGIEMRVIVDERNMATPEYAAQVDRLLQGTAEPESLLANLGLPSVPITTAPSGAQTPKTSSISLKVSTLGSGAFGKVTLRMDVSTGLLYAVKRPNDKALRTPCMLRTWVNEAEILKKVPHANIVTIFKDKSDLSATRPELWLEYISGGDVSEYYGHLTTRECIGILHNCLTALDYLHTHTPLIIHRDIKPNNILVHSRDGRGHIHVKLADFGISKEAEEFHTFCGTRAYQAPELEGYRDGRKRKEGGQGYTEAVDIWSLGLVVLECTRGKYLKKPDGMPASEWCVKMAQYAATAAVTNKDKENGPLCALLAKMVVLNPALRGTAAQRLHECGHLFADLDVWERQHHARVREIEQDQEYEEEEGEGNPTIRAVDVQPSIVSVASVAVARPSAISQKRRAPERSHAAPLTMVGPGGPVRPVGDPLSGHFSQAPQTYKRRKKMLTFLNDDDFRKRKDEDGDGDEDEDEDEEESLSFLRDNWLRNPMYVGSTIVKMGDEKPRTLLPVTEPASNEPTLEEGILEKSLIPEDGSGRQQGGCPLRPCTKSEMLMADKLLSALQKD